MCVHPNVSDVTPSVYRGINVKDVIAMQILECERYALCMYDNLLLFRPNKKTILYFHIRSFLTLAEDVNLGTSVQC